MPQMPPLRDVNAKFEGRDNDQEQRTQKQAFEKLTKRLLVVPQEELQAAIKQEQEEKLISKTAKTR